MGSCRRRNQTNCKYAQIPWSFHSQIPVVRCPRSTDRHAPCTLPAAESVLEEHSVAQLSAPEILQLNRDSHLMRILSKARWPSAVQTGQVRTGWVFQRIMNSLFTSRVENQVSHSRSKRISRFGPRKIGKVGGWCEVALKIGKAATLVMFQPPAPAREPMARIHVPSQPLMRSPLSRTQTPAPPRRVSRFFRVWLHVQVALTSRSLSLLRTGKFYFRQSFQPSTQDKLNSCLIGVNVNVSAKTKYL